MDGIDIIRFFLHDKIAANMWKRTISFESPGFAEYTYTSKLDSNCYFIIIHDKLSNGYGLEVYDHMLTIHLEPNSIENLESFRYSLWVNLKGEACVRIFYEA